MFSDAVSTHYPNNVDWFNCSNETLQLILRKLKYKFPTSIIVQQLTGLPKNYKVFQKKGKSDGEWELFIFGHPRGLLFKSLAQFLPHFRWLLLKEKRLGGICSCTCCDLKLKKKKIPRVIIKLKRKKFNERNDLVEVSNLLYQKENQTSRSTEKNLSLNNSQSIKKFLNSTTKHDLHLNFETGSTGINKKKMCLFIHFEDRRRPTISNEIILENLNNKKLRSNNLMMSKALHILPSHAKKNSFLNNHGDFNIPTLNDVNDKTNVDDNALKHNLEKSVFRNGEIVYIQTFLIISDNRHSLPFYNKASNLPIYIDIQILKDKFSLWPCFIIKENDVKTVHPVVTSPLIIDFANGNLQATSCNTITNFKFPSYQVELIGTGITVTVPEVDIFPYFSQNFSGECWEFIDLEFFEKIDKITTDKVLSYFFKSLALCYESSEKVRISNKSLKELRVEKIKINPTKFVDSRGLGNLSSSNIEEAKEKYLLSGLNVGINAVKESSALQMPAITKNLKLLDSIHFGAEKILIGDLLKPRAGKIPLDSLKEEWMEIFEKRNKFKIESNLLFRLRKIWLEDAERELYFEGDLLFFYEEKFLPSNLKRKSGFWMHSNFKNEKTEARYTYCNLSYISKGKGIMVSLSCIEGRFYFHKPFFNFFGSKQVSFNEEFNL
ncbi:hypothetical protein HK099_007200 [Clydaea vesicula]|uniref:Cryptic loci regulator 2 N-terminal domain-containing protein n=1 Tax=Clydaea vesicula TaxID=447962 RepID=A0AAD5U8M2_9FUNG|nr:hypothetical protein HK099_007200 [Clydaea vesicula]